MCFLLVVVVVVVVVGLGWGFGVKYLILVVGRVYVVSFNVRHQAYS